MNAIYKYTLVPPPRDMVTLSMPKGARILCAHEQHSAICIWAQVQTENPPEPRTFQIYGTGHQITNPDNLAYLGSAFMDGGAFVFHVYERLESVGS